MKTLLLSLLFCLLILSAWGQKPSDQLKIRGTLNAEFSAYGVSNKLMARRQNLAFRIYGQPQIQYGDWKIPMTVILGNYENRFRQTFNKLGIAPTYKGMTFYLGHQNLNFSPLTLNRHTILGAGFELKEGIGPLDFRFGIIGGQLRRSTELDSLFIGNQGASLGRLGLALKLGLGSYKGNYLDLIFFRGSDRDSSLAESGFRLASADNAILGLSGQYGFLQNKLTLKLDYALSALSRDGSARDTSLSGLGMAGLMKVFLAPNTSSRYTSAFLFQGGYEVRQGLQFGVQVDRIEPEFESMGSYFFRNDVFRTYVFGSGQWLENALFVNLRLGIQRNNVEDSRFSTQNQTIASLNANYKVSDALSLNFQLTNFGTRQRLTDPLVQDSILLSQNMNNLSFGINYRLKGERTAHGIQASFMQQGNRNLVLESSKRIFSSTTLRIADRIFFSNANFFLIPAFNLNRIRFAPGTPSLMRIYPSLAGQKSFFQRKLYVTYRLSLILSRRGGASLNRTWRNNVQLRYVHNLHHSFRVRLAQLRSAFPTNIPPDFSEFQMDVGYTYRF